MARKPKRYSKRELINKLRWDLKNRYGVPEDLLDHVDFEGVIREGMTKRQGLEAVVNAHPFLKPYIERKKRLKKVEEVEEDLSKHAELLIYNVQEAERGDETAKSIIHDLLRKAIVEKDKDAIEVIKEAYNMSPGEFARKVLIPAGIITEEEFKALIEEARKVRPPPLPPEKEEEYRRAVEELNKTLKDFKEFFEKFTLEDLRKMGYGGVKALFDKYVSELNLRIEKLEQLKKELPQKAEEIDRLIRRAKREIERTQKLVEGIKPYDIEAVLERALSKVAEKITSSVREALREFERTISKEIRIATGELTPEELKWCCLCFYGDGRLAVRFYDNKAICAVHAKKLEEEWAKHGLQPQWNPDDMGVCTNCGRMVRVFRCSGGLIYCLDCAEELSGKLVFDDQILHVREKARTHIRRIMERLKRY